ncbi:glycogen synthase [Streptomyces capparidis]
MTAPARRAGGPRAPAPPPRVLRLASVFEPLDLTPDWVRFDPVGGMQNHVAELTRCLDGLGLRQYVLTSRLAGPAGRSRLGERAVVARTGIRVPALRQLWAPPALVAALRARGPFDVVHAHSGEDLAVLPVARLAAARHRCPLVVTLHCSLRHTLRDGSPRTALLRLLGGRVERRSVAAADAVVVLTPTAARHLADDGVPPSRLHVIPSGFSPALFAEGRPDPFPGLPRPRIAYIGRLAPQKGVATLLDAHRHCRVPAALLIVGDGPCRPALEARARGRAHFTGFLPHTRIPAVLEHIDVLVLPSVYEELGSVLVEAMAAARPVVAGRVGGIPDLIRDGENGLLADPGDPRSFAAAIDRVLTHPSLATHLGETAHRTARPYAWPRLAERVAGVYDEVIARARGAGR